MRITDAHPDPARADAGIVLSSEQAVGGRDRLTATADAAVAALAAAPWPDGLLSWSLYLDADGDRLLHYAQWTDEQAVDRAGHILYRLYRGSRSAAGVVPGAIVSVRVDTDDGAVARTWVDAVFEALDQDRHLPAGGLGAFFHVSTDGRHVLNYAEWVSADAHRDALAATGQGISSGPGWDRVRSVPGVRPQSVTRYHLHKSLVP